MEFWWILQFRAELSRMSRNIIDVVSLYGWSCCYKLAVLCWFKCLVEFFGSLALFMGSEHDLLCCRNFGRNCFWYDVIVCAYIISSQVSMWYYHLWKWEWIPCHLGQPLNKVKGNRSVGGRGKQTRQPCIGTSSILKSELLPRSIMANRLPGDQVWKNMSYLRWMVSKVMCIVISTYPRFLLLHFELVALLSTYLLYIYFYLHYSCHLIMLIYMPCCLLSYFPK